MKSLALKQTALHRAESLISFKESIWKMLTSCERFFILLQFGNATSAIIFTLILLPIDARQECEGHGHVDEHAYVHT